MDIEKYLTDYKYGKAVLAGAGRKNVYNSLAVDCPFVFWHKNKYMMLHVGFDGKGYQTAISSSKDLVHWTAGRVLFPREKDQGSTRWDKVGVAGTWIVKENNLNKLPTLKRINNKYWMVYHSYPQEGYEAGSADIGLAWCEDEDLQDWHRLEKPVLSHLDGGEWEKGGLYKGCLVENEGKFYLFYNAKQKDEWPWTEQIGVAVSADMINWNRLREIPVLPVSVDNWDCRFAADPFVVKDGEKWVMFYYGFDGTHAMEGLAVSENLMDWKKYSQPILKNGNIGEIDYCHAHKPSILMSEGTLYHFYCAVRPGKNDDGICGYTTGADSDKEYRCITFASNKPVKE